MGKKVRVWICWRFHWLTVGTDKWGPPSFTIWPTATLFLIKCSILKGHVSTCLDPSKLDQDGEYHIETSPLPGWGLLSSGSWRVATKPWGRPQPALLLSAMHPSLSWLLWRNIFSGFSTAGSPGSLFDHLDQLLYYHSLSRLPVRAEWNQSGAKSSGAVYKAHPILRQGFFSCIDCKHLYENSPWGSPRKRNKVWTKP